MKYIRPPDFKSVREFEAHYKKIEQDITELVTTDGSANTAQELNAKLSQALNAAVSYLANVNKRFTNNELPTAFKEGKDSIKDPPKISAKEAAAILEKQGFKYAKNGFSRDTYIELQNATQTALKGMQTRVNSIIKDLHKTGQDSVYNVQQAIMKDLEQHAIFSVTYSNGAKQSLHSYAAMAARSARIESTNIGAIGRALQVGTDHVKMTTMPQCCKLCGAYQGKVYSISGTDKRFPALFKTVLRSGYALPHPNCRHEFIPWYEEIEAPEDVEKAIKNSKIQYDKNGELVDVRYQRDIKGYAEWQAGNRLLNREFLEYEQMKAYYAGREAEMPYKTLGSFRRARRAQTDGYKENRKVWNTMQENTQNGLTDALKNGTINLQANPNAQIDCAVSWKIINTKQHKDNMSLFVGNKEVGKTVARVETQILKHREGTEFEDLYLINARTGKEIAKNLTSSERLKVGKTKEMDDLLTANDDKSYVLIHNHPYSSPPSVADLNSLYKHSKIKYGLIVGHNGTVYKYTAPSAEIKEEELEIAIKHYRNLKYSEPTALEKAYGVLMRKYNFKLEVLKNGK